MTSPGPGTPYTQVTVSGVFGSAAAPIEIWSWSLKFEGAETINDEAASAFTVHDRYVTHLAPLFPAEIVTTRVRVSQHEAGGLVRKNSDGAYIQGDDVRVAAGTGGAANKLPLQTAVCVSLLTARAGATGKGRFFLPYTVHGINADYRLAAASTDAIATAVKGFINSITTLGRPVVVSSKGYRTPVVKIGVGRTLDTMRSRRSHLLDVRSEVTL